MSNRKPGDVYITRNLEEHEGGPGNATPGHWNHTAIYIGNGVIIEAQDALGVV